MRHGRLADRQKDGRAVRSAFVPQNAQSYAACAQRSASTADHFTRSHTMKKVLTATMVVLSLSLSLASVAPASTAGQRNALSSAQSYISMSAFSKSGLIDQLKYEGYSRSEARWAVARLH